MREAIAPVSPSQQVLKEAMSYFTNLIQQLRETQDEATAGSYGKERYVVQGSDTRCHDLALTPARPEKIRAQCARALEESSSQANGGITRSSAWSVEHVGRNDHEANVRVQVEVRV